MTTITQNFSVSFSYSVHFSRDVFNLENEILKNLISSDPGETPKIAFVLDSGLVAHTPNLKSRISAYCAAHLPSAGKHPAVLTIPGGEESKNNPQILSSLYDFLNGAKICRHSYAVVVGGGAVLDVAGYAAATTHRGVRLIRMPTTVLSQNDAGIGVKNSTNVFGKKNFLGTFVPPHAVLNDSQFLETLSQRDWICGVSEAIKVGLIKDSAFFDYIEANADALVQRNPAVMDRVVQRCAELHLDHIASGGDPFESGSSRPLDFGHWSAHKLESLCNYELRHGEAVAIGIELDAVYSHMIGRLSNAELDRIIKLVTTLGFGPYRSRFNLFRNREGLEIALNEFREHLGGRLHIMLLGGIGQGFDANEMDLVVLESALQSVMSRCALHSFEQAA